jgi:hypothetical protein
MDEPSTAGNTSGILGMPTPFAPRNAAPSIAVPDLSKLIEDVNNLEKAFRGLEHRIESLASSSSLARLSKLLESTIPAATGTYRSAGGGGKATKPETAWGDPKTRRRATGDTSEEGGPKREVREATTWERATDMMRALDSGNRARMYSGGGMKAGMATVVNSFGLNGNRFADTGERVADIGTADSIGSNLSGAVNTFMKGITGQSGIGGLLMSAFNGISQLYGAIAGGGIQYAYNRINGPGGNQNAMLQLAQALAPNATMMSAATGKSMGMNQMVAGLAQRMPIMGTQQDMLSTILAGQSVGALMTGTPQRNGFFESARQMQILNPGAAPAQISGGLANYIGNTRSQQMGMMIGEGAFTMIGKGGRYKSLAEWAVGIMKFFEQHRPGSAQGKAFSAEDLMAQNFPGSNINSWFQAMGVPQDMVDYWWQYALTTAGKEAGPVTTDTLKKMVDSTRGINLGYERLRNVTQGTKRDYLMGGQMYGMYAARESADRRFNVAMQGTDKTLATTLRTTNAGRLLSLLPTPIMEMIMPLLTQLATSPLGGAAAAVGGLMGAGNSIKDSLMPANDPIPYGDPMPYGAPMAYKDTGMSRDTYNGPAGDRGLGHLAPDLASKVSKMLRANPNLKISSSYRDTVTQNRLRRNGNTGVGHPSRGSHARGWAIDIGPMSQTGWLKANAGKFGLQTAAAQGEPWHIQQAGTMPVGDPMPFGSPSGEAMPFGGLLDFATGGISGIFSKVGDFIISALGKIVKPIMEAAMSPMTSLMQMFIGSGSASAMIDTSIATYSKVMTAPLSGLMQLLGPAKDNPKELQDLINQSATVSVPTSTYAGFTSSGKNIDSGQQIFGDPVAYMNSGGGGPTINANINPPIIFKADITLNGVGNNAADARRAASVIVTHMADEVNKKKWLVT